MIYGLVQYDWAKLFELAPDAGLRKHYLALRFVNVPRYDVRRYQFAIRVVKLWNDLPEAVVAFATTKKFKTRLHDSGSLPLL